MYGSLKIELCQVEIENTSTDVLVLEYQAWFHTVIRIGHKNYADESSFAYRASPYCPPKKFESLDLNRRLLLEADNVL